MHKVLFVTPGPIEWASSRIRAHWVAEHIEGAQVIEAEKFTNQDADVYIFIKVQNSEIVRNLKADGKRVYWDICDPSHWFEPQESYETAETVDGIIASNNGLADDFNKWYGDDKAIVIRDRLRLEHYIPRRTISIDRPVRFVWFGANQNRFSLMAAMAPLQRLTADGIDITLTICDDHPTTVWDFGIFPIYHTIWSLQNENKIICAHDIAILPDYPGAWGKVKSNNRFLSAMACGVVPTTGEDWNELYRLSVDPEYRKQIAAQGIKTVREHYDVRQSAQAWKDIICE